VTFTGKKRIQQVRRSLIYEALEVRAAHASDEPGAVQDAMRYGRREVAVGGDGGCTIQFSSQRLDGIGQGRVENLGWRQAFR
jgi:hypothetical protein